jgi:hypothetical protein
LKANHPDYRYIIISLDQLDILLINSNISLLFPSIIDESIITKEPLVTVDLPPPNSKSIILNLNITTTKINLLLAGISGCIPLPPVLLVLSIQLIPLDKAAGREKIFTIAFFMFYPIGRVDFNAARQRKIDLNNYT